MGWLLIYTCWGGSQISDNLLIIFQLGCNGADCRWVAKITRAWLRGSCFRKKKIIKKKSFSPFLKKKKERKKILTLTRSGSSNPSENWSTLFHPTCESHLPSNLPHAKRFLCFASCFLRRERERKKTSSHTSDLCVLNWKEIVRGGRGGFSSSLCPNPPRSSPAPRLGEDPWWHPHVILLEVTSCDVSFKCMRP